MKEGSLLMHQAHETNKRFQVVLDEIIRLEKLIS